MPDEVKTLSGSLVLMTSPAHTLYARAAYGNKISRNDVTRIQTELDDTMSCYQLIKTMKKFEKRTKHRLSG